MTSRVQALSSVSPLCQQHGGPRVELCLVKVEGLEDFDDPFLALGDGGRLSRTLLGRVVLGDTTLQHLAFKVQRDVVLASTSGFGNATLGNLEVEAIWDREIRNLAAARSPQVAAAFGSRETSTFSPTTFCKKTRQYFHPVSPQTRERLTVCKDDDLLRECGLRPYSTGTTRYLFSPGAAMRPRSDGQQVVFYTQSGPGEEYPAPGVHVRRGSELYRDLSRVVRAGFGADDHPGVSSSFPCVGCAFREECFPADATADAEIPAERRLVPLTYYDSPMLALELCHLRYGELADLLGGAEWSDVAPRVQGPGGAERHITVGAMSDALSGPRQYFSMSTDKRQRAIEILRLKLNAFEQVCAGLVAVHGRTCEALFDVSPHNVMAQWCGPDGGVRPRWRFDVKLIDLGAAQPYRPPTAALRSGPDVWVPVADVDRRFVSPFIERSNLGRDFVLRFTAREVRREEAGQVLCLEGRASGAPLEGMQVGDSLQIQLNTPVRQLSGLELVARVTRSGFRAVDAEVSLPESVNPDTWSLPFTFDGVALALPRLGVPCDLYGLGMLLFRALLVNDGQEFSSVVEKLRRVVERFELDLSSIEGADASYASMTMRRILREEGRGFDAAEVVFDGRLRKDAAVAEAIPASLWSEILMFGLRLMTSAPGFSYAAHHADYDHDDPAALIRRVHEDLERIRARVDMELFGRAARDHELAALCESRMLEIGEQLLDSRHATKVHDELPPVPGLERGAN